MNFEQLKTIIESYSPEDFLKFLEENKPETRSLFFYTPIDRETMALARETFLQIQIREFDDKIIQETVFQDLITQFSILFKRKGYIALLHGCRLFFRNNQFFNRIEAYTTYREFSSYESYLDRFPEYLEIISRSININGDFYIDEIVDDVLEYYWFTSSQFKKIGREDLIIALFSLLSDSDLLVRFSFIEEVRDRIEFANRGLIIRDRRLQTYQPSDFLSNLFLTQITNPIKAHPKTVWSTILMGYDFNTIRTKILKNGLANFDEPYEKLSAADKVKLYCHANARKHFFTSIHLFDGLPNLIKYYETGNRIKFIDIGCGPGTSGLALLDHLNQKINKKVVLDYVGVDVSETMLNEAKSMFINEIIDNRSQLNFTTKLPDISSEFIANISCIIINTCYLFASESLKIEPLTVFVNTIKTIVNISTSPVFIFHQNAMGEEKNKKYEDFKAGIGSTKTIFSSNDTINYYTQATNFAPQPDTTFYEILQLEK